VPNAIDLCSVAWAGQDGYVFLSLRDPNKSKKDNGYWRDLTFKWPENKYEVGEALDKAKSSKKDVYWCPNVFSGPHRDNDAVENINVLYADLDEADPHKLPAHLKPTAAWRTSPGRWQALWQLDRAIDSTTQSQLNQRLTYAIGADKGGWDITQVLRTPDTPNHKYPDNPKVKLLWLNGHTVNPVKLIDDLPEVESIEIDRTAIAEVPDQVAVLRKYGKKVTPHAKRLIKARRAKVGTRSEVLWELECLLAEAGMKADEIVGVVRPTVWNKFADRHDEMRQLSGEARKAIDHIGSVTAKAQDNGHATEELEEVIDVEPLSWTTFDAEHEPVRWMVAELWGEGEVGFISGHPKSYKSWLAIDLAISVATGTRFLGSFAAKKHNVLLIQEEDPKPIMQERLAMVGASKGLLGCEVNGDGTFEMWYNLPDNLYIISNQGFTINEDWLDQLEAWIMKRDIKLVILDPLMMMGEDVDEFKAFEVMSQILKPLKRLRARTQTAIAVVHHHTKGAGQGGAKDMYGSVALWAWEEAALHLNVVGMGTVIAERFSKHSLLKPITIEIGEIKETWEPQIVRVGAANLYDALVGMEGGATVEQLVSYTGLGREAVDRQLKQLEADGKVEKAGKRSKGQGRPSVMWRVKA
jgi:AAA domain/RepB DNA-primase from phage plasmid